MNKPGTYWAITIIMCVIAGPVGIIMAEVAVGKYLWKKFKQSLDDNDKSAVATWVIIAAVICQPLAIGMVVYLLMERKI